MLWVKEQIFDINKHTNSSEFFPCIIRFPHKHTQFFTIRLCQYLFYEKIFRVIGLRFVFESSLFSPYRPFIANEFYCN